MFAEKMRDWDITEQLYLELKREYFLTLKQMPFSRRNTLLKYFGYSFFHDYKILNISIGKQSLVMQISGDNILEDINHWRENSGLEPVRYDEFWKKPVKYTVSFLSPRHLNLDLELDNDLMMLDSEIVSYDKNKGCHLVLTMDDDSSMEFYCKAARVTIDTDLISLYTDDRLTKIAYCETCRSRLLSMDKVNRFLSESI